VKTREIDPGFWRQRRELGNKVQWRGGR
jgi:hypothetical protein